MRKHCSSFANFRMRYGWSFDESRLDRLAVEPSLSESAVVALTTASSCPTRFTASLLVSLLVCVTLSSRGFGQATVSKVVRTRGEAVVLKGNLAAAFEEAKGAALREAVEEALGVMASSQTRVRNFALIEDDILTRSAGYVRSFDVVGRGAGEGEGYFVVIDAVVDLNNLHRDVAGLSLLFEAAGRPRISCEGTGFTLSEDGETQEATNLGGVWNCLSPEL